MKRNYSSPEVEIVESLDVVTTSREVETEKIPLGVNGAALEGMFDL